MAITSSYEAGHSPRIQRGETAPAISLAAYNGFFSATYQSFALKAGHLPSDPRTAVVIIDVLRATTTWTAIAAAGARAIRIAVKDYANDRVLPVPDDTWLQAGEKDGKPMPGGVIGNSPTEVKGEVFRGASVVFYSTNGARAVQAAAGFSDNVYLACLPNIEATCRAIAADGIRNVVFIAGGFYGAATLEDTVCAGRGLKWLVDLQVLSPLLIDDEARMAIAAADAFDDGQLMIATLLGAQVGKLLARIGRAADVEAVVNGRGIDPAVWAGMRSTVLVYSPDEGVFAPAISDQAEVATTTEQVFQKEDHQ
jgi:phosphosulfolactate phosphohydrolase-like enzyme